MKQLKRFLALVLVGVLALTVLTGCGSTNSTFGAEAESQIVAAVNDVRDENKVPLTNDSTLRAQCATALSHIDADGKVALKYARSESRSYEGTTLVVVGLAMDIQEEGFKIQNYTGAMGEILVTARELTQSGVASQVAGIKNDTKTYNAISRMGVATRTVNGKTYLAMAIELKVQR